MTHHDAGTSLDANRGYGEKGHFRKISVTLPPDAYERLIHESARRKIAGEPNQLLAGGSNGVLESVGFQFSVAGSQTSQFFQQQANE